MTKKEPASDIKEAVELYCSGHSIESMQGLEQLIRLCWEGRAQEVVGSKGLLDAALCHALSEEPAEEYLGASLLHVLSVYGAQDALNGHKEFARAYEKLQASENADVKNLVGEIERPSQTRQKGLNRVDARVSLG